MCNRPPIPLLVLAPIVTTDRPKPDDTAFVNMLILMAIVALLHCGWQLLHWGWQRWQRWHRIVLRACPICRRYPDAEFVDCRNGDCITGYLWRPGVKPWPPGDADEWSVCLPVLYRRNGMRLRPPRREEESYL